ncbi:MAG: hypothetical protein ABIH86_02605 [Planctomycetota bacterium]
MVKQPLPITLNMSICDLVIRDQKTNNVSLINLFNQIVCGQLPFRHHRMHVYVALTEGRGNYVGELKLKHTADNQTILTVKGDVKMADPLSVTEMDFELRNVEFKRVGKYHVELLIDGGIVGSRSFYVRRSTDTTRPRSGDDIETPDAGEPNGNAPDSGAPDSDAPSGDAPDSE